MIIPVRCPKCGRLIKLVPHEMGFPSIQCARCDTHFCPTDHVMEKNVAARIALATGIFFVLSILAASWALGRGGDSAKADAVRKAVPTISQENTDWLLVKGMDRIKQAKGMPSEKDVDQDSLDELEKAIKEQDKAAEKPPKPIVKPDREDHDNARCMHCKHEFRLGYRPNGVAEQTALTWCPACRLDNTYNAFHECYEKRHGKQSKFRDKIPYEDTLPGWMDGASKRYKERQGSPRSRDNEGR